ncbi:hypothetical protein EYF80_059466 [Liparis tanakae]|uniref:Uncharacterized protein n=1 Tax=Liparis tanakae TaxID=230148 RepID=A0A4Z2EPZ3_9TELE|nr:hypothetical protein EYF80_059466 [Liparis tanakae]
MADMDKAAAVKRSRLRDESEGEMSAASNTSVRPPLGARDAQSRAAIGESTATTRQLLISRYFSRYIGRYIGRYISC